MVKKTIEINDLERLIIAISAAAYCPSGRKHIVDIAYSFSPTKIGGEFYTRKEIEEATKELQQKGIFTDAPLQLDRGYADEVTRELFTTGLLGPIANAILDNQSIYFMMSSFGNLPRIKSPVEYHAYLRLTLLSGRFQNFTHAYYSYSDSYTSTRMLWKGEIFALFFLVHDIADYSLIPDEVILILAREAQIAHLLLGLPIPNDFVEYIENNIDDLEMHADLLALLMVSGEFDKIKQLKDIFLEVKHPINEKCIDGTFHFLFGSNEDAIDSFEDALKLKRKQEGKSNVFLDNIFGVYYSLALLRSNDPKLIKRVRTLYKNANSGYECKTMWLPIFSEVANIAYDILGDVFDSWRNPAEESSPFPLYLRAVRSFWKRPEKSIDLSELKRAFDECVEINSLWIANELNYFIHMLEDKGNLFAFEDDYPRCFPISTYYQVRGDWEKKVNALELFIKESEDLLSKRKERIVWFIDFYYRSFSDEIYPSFYGKRQTCGKTGKWSKGKVLSYGALQKHQNDPNCDPIDRDIIGSIVNPYGYDFSSGNNFDGVDSILHLSKHPLLFSADNENQRIELNQTHFEITYHESDEHLILSLPLKGQLLSNVLIEQTGPYHYQFCLLKSEEMKLLKIFDGEQVKVPISEKKRVRSLVSSMTKVATIQSDEIVVEGEIEEVLVSSTPLVYLNFKDEVLELSFWIRPYEGAHKMWAPSDGHSQTVVSLEDKRVKLIRHLDEEKRKFELTVSGIEHYLEFSEKGANSFVSSGLSNSLDVLYLLKDFAEQGVIELFWPKGVGLDLSSRSIDYDKLKVKSTSNQDWFSLSGEVKVDEELVITLTDLIKKSSESSLNGFIKLDNGAFVKIASSMKRELEKVHAMGMEEDESLAFHRSALLSSKEFFEKVNGMKRDQVVSKFYKKLDSLWENDPCPASTFKAELRDYQNEGYTWLRRLSELGFGACLADDMGLGKTIQTIALLLDRARKGPALVVAPVSVLMNWENELRRFAPALNVYNVRDVPSNERNEIVENAKEMDVLLASYGVVQREQIIAQKKWCSTVLDEAQAIKNHSTKRAKSCFALCSDFKMVTTGTPVENHYGELWSIFHFINPGLLGSFKNFSQRYMSESDSGLRNNQNVLKQIIAPYILRRKKCDVLTELPSKTEVVLKCKMRDNERAFYESIRRTAVENITNGDESGRGIVKVLAELTRLRQTACDPRLLSGDFKIKSSKLELFHDLLEKILDGGHKVLVFSQFVRYLKLIEIELKEKGVSYQYLDGSTTPKKRVKAVQDFQAGIGDVFLISLKAGGFGLNLTAADYVIHMDPWWNPAVETQATDRAHRIGQTNPVTVYKLVAEHTIEDRILELHGKKREMAETLLDSSDGAGKMDPKLLLQLLTQ